MRALQELTINRRMRALLLRECSARGGLHDWPSMRGRATVDPDVEGVLPSRSSSDPEAKVGRLR